MNLPNKALFRRGELVNVLGVSEWTVRQLIDSGQLTRVYPVPGRGRAYYRRREVVEVLRTLEGGNGELHSV